MKKPLVTGKYYRVMPISRFLGIHPATGKIEVGALPLSEGVAIEEKTHDGHYFVCTFVKPDFKRNTVLFEDVDFRSITTLNPKNIEKLDEWLNCVDFAKNVMHDIMEAMEENEY